jgi:hypothetical protein
VEKPKFVLPTALIGVSSVPAKAKIVKVSLEGKVGSRVDSTKYRGNGHWQFPEPLGAKGYIGFIYIIRDVMTEKLYLGKKQFKGLGKINKGEDSNWRWYISSSKELSQSIKTHGKNNFEFIAIEQYKSKGGLSYAESWSLFDVQASINRDIWYNLLINKVSWVVKENITERHKERMLMMLKAVDAHNRVTIN